MAADKDIPEISLEVRTAQQLSIRASLVSRGMQNISDYIYDEAVKTSMELCKQDRIDEAVGICHAALKTSPGDDVLLQIMGMCFAKLGNHSEALRCFDQAIKEHPNNAYCWSIKASFLWEIGEYADAITCDSKAIDVDPNDPFFRQRRESHVAALRQFSKNSFQTQGQVASIKWADPEILLTLYSRYVEPIPGSPCLRGINFICEAENISDNSLSLGKEIEVFHRSRVTGKFSSIGDAIFLAPELILPAQSTSGPLQLELVINCDENTSDEDCMQKVLTDSDELLAFDHKFETTIAFVDS